MLHADRVRRMITVMHEGGVGSGHWAHTGVKGKRGGSAPDDGSVPKHQSQGFQRRILSAIGKSGGVTISVKGDVPKVGYVVGGAGEELIKPWADLTVDDVNEYVNRNINELAKANHYFGAWVDGPKVYFDVSTVRMDKDEAVAEGRARNQISVWDLKGGRAYDCKTGDVYMSESERSSPTLMLFGKNVSAEDIVAEIKKVGQQQVGSAQGRRMITSTRKDK